MTLSSEWRAVRTLLRGVETRYVSLFMLAVVAGILELVSIGLVFPLLHLVLQGDAEGLPEIVKTIIAQPPLSNSFERVGIALVIAFIAKSIGKFLVEYSNAKITNEIRGGWMRRLFGSYVHHRYSFFLKEKHGSLIHNLFDLTDQCMSALRQMVNVAMYGISSAIVLVAMFSISTQATLAILVVIAVVYGLSRPLVATSIRLGKRRLKAYHEVNNIPTEAFKGIREIKTYSAQHYIQQLYERAVQRMVTLRVKLNFYQLVPTAFPEPVLIGFLVGALLMLDRRGVDIASVLPLIATYVYAAYRLVVNASALAKDLVTFVSHVPSIQLLGQVMSAAGEESTALPSDVRTGEVEAQPLQLTDVSFSYQANKQTLDSVSFTCPARQITALVGPSGSGKSTIADLLIRLYEPDQGQIVFGDTDSTSLPVSAWRSRIGFVSQDTFLFHGTIRENIVFGMTEQVSDKALEQAAGRANAHSFIMETERGYDTVVGERGALLSGGQRQRIAIARALIREPALLILDEATSALDQQAQKLIMETVMHLKDSMTIVMITHQLSLAAQADHIVVLRDGRVREAGDHQSLLAQQGEYYALAHMQLESTSVDTKE